MIIQKFCVCSIWLSSFYFKKQAERFKICIYERLLIIIVRNQCVYTQWKMDTLCLIIFIQKMLLIQHRLSNDISILERWPSILNEITNLAGKSYPLVTFMIPVRHPHYKDHLHHSRPAPTLKRFIKTRAPLIRFLIQMLPEQTITERNIPRWHTQN